MKTITVASLLITAVCSFAAAPPVKVDRPNPPVKIDRPGLTSQIPVVKETSLYAASQFSLVPFAAVRFTEFNKTTEKWAGGLALSYAPVDNIEIEAAAISYKLQDDPVIESFDEGSVNFKGYLPLGKSGWAPYGLVGYTRDHANDENMINVGAGLAYRLSRVRAFVDGQYRRDPTDERASQALFRLGLGIGF